MLLVKQNVMKLVVLFYLRRTKHGSEEKEPWWRGRRERIEKGSRERIEIHVERKETKGN